MRNLTAEEIDKALDDNGEPEDGFVAIEARVEELAAIGAGTACGKVGNHCFVALAAKGYGKRMCRGWFCENPMKAALDTLDTTGNTPEMAAERVASIKASWPTTPQVTGMFHIRIQTDKTAEKVSRIAGEAEGSLRFSGDSLWEGYKEFEIE